MLCCRVQNLLSAFCDDELSGAQMLQIRRHLSQCRQCREEHAQLLQMKQLMGALSGAGPRRPLSIGEIELRARMAPPRPRWARVVSEWVRFALSGMPRAQRGTPFLALSTGLALCAMVLGMLGTPQHRDAVAAHVPSAVSDEDNTASEARQPRYPARWAQPAMPEYREAAVFTEGETEPVAPPYHRVEGLPSYYTRAMLDNPLFLSVSYENRLSEMPQLANKFSR